MFGILCDKMRNCFLYEKGEGLLLGAGGGGGGGEGHHDFLKGCCKKLDSGDYFNTLIIA
jgi:hypothetical protein